MGRETMDANAFQVKNPRNRLCMATFLLLAALGGRSAAGQAAWLARYRKTLAELPTAVDRKKLSKSGQAHPVDPAEPWSALRRALAFLQLPLPASATDVHDLLAQALAGFEPSFLPHCSGYSAA